MLPNQPFQEKNNPYKPQSTDTPVIANVFAQNVVWGKLTILLRDKCSNYGRGLIIILIGEIEPVTLQNADMW